MSVEIVRAIEIIANDPTSLNQYPEIPAQELQHSMNRWGVAAAIGLGIISLIAHQYNRYVTGVLLLASAVVLFKSYSTQMVDSPAYKQQTSQVKKLFNGCIELLNQETVKKAKAIFTAVNGKKVPSIVDVKAAVDTANSSYDDGLNLRSSAVKLILYKMDSFPKNLNPLVKTGMESLRIAAGIFLYGFRVNRKNDPSHDAYVPYQHAQGEAYLENKVFRADLLEG